MGGKITEYAFISVMGLMFAHILIAIGVIRMEKKLPELYEKSIFKPNKFFRLFWSIGVIVIGVVYIAIGFVEAPLDTAIFFGLMAVCPVLYFDRQRRLKQKGRNLSDIFEKDLNCILSKIKKVHKYLN